MNHLTEKERIEILMITGYGDRKRSHQEACPLFNETHPNRNPISKSTVTKTLKRFNETGSVTNRLKVGRPRKCTNEDNSFNILLRYCYDLNFAVNRKGEKGEIRGCFQCATGAGEPVEEDRSGWETVQEEFQPYVAADKGFLHEGHRPYASADHFRHPVGPASSPRIPPENRTSHRTVPGRGTRVQEQLLSGKVLQRLSFCSPPSWLFSFT
jgi:hypothetical protein